MTSVCHGKGVRTFLCPLVRARFGTRKISPQEGFSEPQKEIWHEELSS